MSNRVDVIPELSQLQRLVEDQQARMADLEAQIATASPVGKRSRLWRSRWAAIGAAVAVAFGGGTLALVTASGGDASSFVPVTPVRVLDTRADLGLSGPFASLTARDLPVTGTIATAVGAQLVVPAGATAVVLNVTVVEPTAAGFLSLRPADAVGAPTTSSLNFVAGAVVPNAVTVKIPTSGGDAGKIEITYDAYSAVGPTTHLLVDVVGYYQANAAAPEDATEPAAGATCNVGGLNGVIVNGFDREHAVSSTCFTGLVTTLAGSTSGFNNGIGAEAQFNNPYGVAVDTVGNVYVADLTNHRIRKITPAGVVTTLAGSGVAGFNNATGVSAQFDGPNKLAVDTAGNVYVADTNNHRIRKITAAGVVSTLAGSGVGGFNDATGEFAQFDSPSGVAVDAAGNVYVADSSNRRIRKVTPAGVVTTLAGSGVGGFNDAAGEFAQFSFPEGVAVDAAGNVYVADGPNRRIRKVTPAGVVSTIAGQTSAGSLDGIGIAAQFNQPADVAVDAAGNLYVADLANHRIRKIN